MLHDIIDNLEVKLSEVLKQKLAIAKKARGVVLTIVIGSYPQPVFIASFLWWCIIN